MLRTVYEVVITGTSDASYISYTQERCSHRPRGRHDTGELPHHHLRWEVEAGRTGFKPHPSVSKVMLDPLLLRSGPESALPTPPHRFGVHLISGSVVMLVKISLGSLDGRAGLVRSVVEQNDPGHRRRVEHGKPDRVQSRVYASPESKRERETLTAYLKLKSDAQMLTGLSSFRPRIYKNISQGRRGKERP